MKKDPGKEHSDIIDVSGIYEGVTCQEIFLNKRVFVERYLLDIKPSLEIIIFVGLNITPSVKYFGHFPHNLFLSEYIKPVFEAIKEYAQKLR